MSVQHLYAKIKRQIFSNIIYQKKKENYRYIELL